MKWEIWQAAVAKLWLFFATLGGSIHGGGQVHERSFREPGAAEKMCPWAGKYACAPWPQQKVITEACADGCAQKCMLFKPLRFHKCFLKLWFSIFRGFSKKCSKLEDVWACRHAVSLHICRFNAKIEDDTDASLVLMGLLYDSDSQPVGWTMFGTTRSGLFRSVILISRTQSLICINLQVPIW